MSFYKLLDAFAKRVVAKLPEYLAEQEGLLEATFPMFATVQRGYKDIFSLPKYDGIMFVPQVGTSVRADRDLTLTVHVVMVHESKKPEELVLRQLAYSQALVDLIDDDPRLGGKVEAASVNSIEYLPAAPGTKEVCVTVVRVTVRAYHNRECL